MPLDTTQHHGDFKVCGKIVVWIKLSYKKKQNQSDECEKGHGFNITIFFVYLRSIP